MATNGTSQVIKNKGFNNFNTSEMIFDGLVGAVSGKIGGVGKGNYALKNAAKLMNKNATVAMKNCTKNGVKSAVKFYNKSRPVR